MKSVGIDNAAVLLMVYPESYLEVMVARIKVSPEEIIVITDKKGMWFTTLGECLVRNFP